MTTIAQLIASHKAALAKMREIEAGPSPRLIFTSRAASFVKISLAVGWPFLPPAGLPLWPGLNWECAGGRP